MSVATLRSDAGGPGRAPVPLERRLQRANGRARLAFAARAGGTGLASLYQRSPCRALFPRAAQPHPEAVLLNTAGGVAGGDRLSYEVAAGAGTRVVVSTQAAERIYRSLGLPGRISNRLEVGEGAMLDWLPQETILFDGARLHRRTDVDITGDGRLLAVDWLVLGRQASGETVRTGEVHDRWRVRRDGRLIWADDIRLSGDIEALVGRPALLAGATAMASLIYVAGDAGEHLRSTRAVLADGAGRAAATLLDGVLLCRFLGDDARLLRRDVGAALCHLRSAIAGCAQPLPRVWTC